MLLAAAILAVEVGRYHLQSNLWVSLHQRLMCEARNFETLPAPAGADAAKWKAEADAYRLYFGKKNAIFDDELVRLNMALSQTKGGGLPEGLPPAAAAVLKESMPLYEAQWEIDDHANRFWIALAQPMLASAGEELAEAHAKAYGRAFPTHIRVDLAPCGWQFGAYTTGEGDRAQTVIMSTNAGTQGFAALESLMHEPSHAIVDGIARRRHPHDRERDGQAVERFGTACAGSARPGAGSGPR